jgi:hypothetical protein
LISLPVRASSLPPYNTTKDFFVEVIAPLRFVHKALASRWDVRLISDIAGDKGVVFSEIRKGEPPVEFTSRMEGATWV